MRKVAALGLGLAMAFAASATSAAAGPGVPKGSRVFNPKFDAWGPSPTHRTGVFTQPTDPWAGKRHHKRSFHHSPGFSNSPVFVDPVWFWVPGYWGWNGFTWVWVPGYWTF